MKHKLLKVTIPACYTAHCSRGSAVVEHFVCVFYMSETVIKLNSFFCRPAFGEKLIKLLATSADFSAFMRLACARARVVPNLPPLSPFSSCFLRIGGGGNPKLFLPSRLDMPIPQFAILGVGGWQPRIVSFIMP